MLNNHNYKRFDNSKLPVPEELVCGATTDKDKYWKWVSYNSKVCVGKIKSDKVSLKYFGYRKSLESFCSSLVYQLCIVENSNCEPCPLKYTCSSYISKKPINTNITFADLFCGCGGLSLGFENVGLIPKVAMDIDPWFLLTYMYNRPKLDIDYLATDISDWIFQKKHIKKWNIDIISGGVPCQSFSTANRQPLKKDSRGYLYKSLLLAAKMIMPKLILIENVSGMLKKYDDIINDLDKLDYKTTYMKLNSSHFGIPQNRRRIFFVALNRKSITKRKQKFKIFHETVKDQENSKSVLLREAISDLPPLVAHRKNYDTSFNNNISGRSLIIHDISNASEYVKKINYNRSLGALFNHKARYNNPRDVEIFGLLKEGDNSLSKSIQNLNPYKNRNNIFIDKYFKLKYDDICKTITAHMRYDCNMYIHPEQARGLTAREAARVQSFPDNYVFLGNFQRTYQQIGNAVPPKLASVLGNAIKEIL